MKIIAGSCCCDFCEFCNATPTTVRLVFGGIADGSCGGCSEFNDGGGGPGDGGFTLTRVEGETCVWFLSFDEAEITCYSVEDEQAGFYAELDENGWIITILGNEGGDLYTIAEWTQVSVFNNNCLESLSGTDISLDSADNTICNFSNAALSVFPN